VPPPDSGWTPAGDFELSLDGDSITITKYKGDAAIVNIPARIDGIPVTAIGEGAFYKCGSLTNVSIPSSVTSIEYAAFAGCGSLTSVSIPSSVMSIGNYVFAGCGKLSAETREAIRRRFGDGVF
jgi:hypothetical protein